MKINKIQLQAGIDLIISSAYLEESAREFRSQVVIKEKINMLDGRAQRFSPSEVINKDCEKVIEACKTLNSHIEQIMIKKKGRSPISDMAYDLVEIFREISYLGIPKQKRIYEFVKKVRDEKTNSTNKGV